jgi:hypothetical protein
VSLQSALGLLLAGLLLSAAGAKLLRPRRSAAALAGFGLGSVRARTAGLAGLIAAELALGVGVGLDRPVAAYAAAAMMALFALAAAAALRRGRGGAPCPCFGARTTITRRIVAGDALFAVVFAGLPSVPGASVPGSTWLAAGLALALAGLFVLAVVVLGLAREVGELRLRLGPQLALELADEGPPLGRPVSLIERFALDGDVGLAVAVFSSAGCPLCRALEPAVAWLASDPFVAMASFDEALDADVWRALEIPGSPYAVVLGPTGTVLAKGAFNTGGQLEGMLATAERRAALTHAPG